MSGRTIREHIRRFFDFVANYEVWTTDSAIKAGEKVVVGEQYDGV